MSAGELVVTSTVRRSETCGALFAALAVAQGSFGIVVKDRTAKVTTKTGAGYTYDYATKASLQSATRPALAANGLCLMQHVTALDNRATVTAILGHASGEWVESELSADIPSDGRMSPLQTLGSVFSFLERYQWAGVCGVSSEDEDDDAGADNEPRQAPQAQRRPAPEREAPSPRKAAPALDEGEVEVPFDVHGPGDADPWAKVRDDALTAIGLAGDVSGVLAQVVTAESLTGFAHVDAVRQAACRRIIEVARTVPELAELSAIGKRTTANKTWHADTIAAYGVAKSRMTVAK